MITTVTLNNITLTASKPTAAAGDQLVVRCSAHKQKPGVAVVHVADAKGSVRLIDLPSAPFAYTIPPAFLARNGGAYTITVEQFVSKVSVDRQQFVVQRPMPTPVPVTGELHGFCFNDSDGDGTLDANEKGSGAREVMIRDAAGQVVAAMTTDDKGLFKRTLPAGVYFVERLAFPAGFEPSTGDKGVHRVEVVSGQRVDVLLGTRQIKPSPSPTPGGNTPGSGGAPKPATRIGLCLVKAAWLAVPSFRELIAPIAPEFVANWTGTKDFQRKDYDADLFAAVAIDKALGATTVHRLAQTGMTPAMALLGPDWHETFARRAIEIYDADPATRGKPIWMQLGNEPDLDGHYWDGTPAEYVALYLAPIATRLREKFGRRLVLIAAGFSWKVPELRACAAAVAATGVDYLAFHGYPTTDYTPYAAVRAIADAVGLKVFVSEGANGTNKQSAAARKAMATETDPKKRAALNQHIRTTYDLARSRVAAGLVHVAKARIDIFCLWISVPNTTHDLRKWFANDKDSVNSGMALASLEDGVFHATPVHAEVIKGLQQAGLR